MTSLFAWFSALAALFPAFFSQFAHDTPAMRCGPLPLYRRLVAISRVADGKVGAVMMVLESGKMLAVLDADSQFPMQSVYKLPIGMATLEQVDRGTLSLDQMVRVEKQDFVSPGQLSPIRDRHPDGVELTLRELLRFTVQESDGTASDVVMRLAGGAGRVDAYLHGLGIDTIKVVNTEQEMGRDATVQYRNWATPRGAVKLLQALQTRRTLSDTSRALLQRFLTETKTGPNRIKGLLPDSTIVAHKTGGSGTNRAGLAAATNDIGLVTLPDGRHLVIAIFVKDSKANDVDRDRVIAQIAKAGWDCLATNSAERQAR